MNTEDAAHVEHEPIVVEHDGANVWDCRCGARWPCRAMRLADDAGWERARIMRARRAYAVVRTQRPYQERSPGEFWRTGLSTRVDVAETTLRAFSDDLNRDRRAGCWPCGGTPTG